jgi:hypothetical protein
MKEWVFRRGYETRARDIKLKWYMYLVFMFVLDEILFYKVPFIDLINEKGEVRRIYPKCQSANDFRCEGKNE